MSVNSIQGALDQKEALVNCLTDLGFLRAPPFDDNGYGEVCLSHPDGVYFNIALDGRIQLIIVGPMPRTPFVLCQEINGRMGDPDYPGFWVKSVEFIHSTETQSPGHKQIVIERSYISAVLVRHDVEERPV